LASAVALLQPSRSSGTGQGAIGGASGGGIASTGRAAGGAQRATRRSAATAGRAAAAAYAYRTADRAELERLGLDYDELRRIDDPLELTRVIVEAACGSRSESTIEDHEERYVAAEIAAWVLEQNAGGTPPDPEAIVRKTIATIIVEVVETEIGEILRRGDRPTWAAELVEGELHEAAEVLAEQAELSLNGASAEEFSRAIEDGIETLRRILGGAG
jgi:hypothetical protein